MSHYRSLFDRFYYLKQQTYSQGCLYELESVQYGKVDHHAPNRYGVDQGNTYQYVILCGETNHTKTYGRWMNTRWRTCAGENDENDACERVCIMKNKIKWNKQRKSKKSKKNMVAEVHVEAFSLLVWSQSTNYPRFIWHRRRKGMTGLMTPFTSRTMVSFGNTQTQSVVHAHLCKTFLLDGHAQGFFF